MMPRRIVLSMLVGVFVVAFASLALAEAPVHPYSDTLAWQEREAMETGAIPPVPGGSTELRCCDRSVDAGGNTVILPEIDSGP